MQRNESGAFQEIWWYREPSDLGSFYALNADSVW